jgi:lipid II:glycine glycyltransferase (peptidoglycan interpeptide bridge formation enzyme)
MLTIKEINHKDFWESFVKSQSESTFLHSWNWGEFHKVQGSKIWRLGLFEDNQLLGAALVIKIEARRGTFLFVPQGPIFRVSDFEFQAGYLESLVAYLRQLAKKEGCSFIRISPLMTKTTRHEKLFSALGFRRAPLHMHAELMWILDITPKEEELLRDMRKTTRYSIRKAGQEGVKIIKSCELADVKRFNRIYQETARRQKFSPYSLNYLEQEFNSFVADNQISIFLAEYQGAVVAGAIVIFYNESAFYHHGASSGLYKQVPAAYLLQWEAIKEAKRRGCKFYNFWGISKQGENHPWAGLTLFKKGFGGFDKEYLPAQDLPLRPQYWLNFLVEKIRKIRRRL